MMTYSSILYSGSLFSVFGFVVETEHCGLILDDGHTTRVTNIGAVQLIERDEDYVGSRATLLDNGLTDEVENLHYL